MPTRRTPAGQRTPDPSDSDQATPAPTAEKAAEHRRDAMAGVESEDRAMVDALLVERRGYVQRDLKDRVTQVDEQLRLRGYRTA